MGTVLLSIKRPFAQEIMSGRKCFEYRKCLPREKPSQLVIYESAGCGRIIGSAAVDGYLSGPVQEIWDITSPFSGIEPKFYQSYFNGRLEANAFCLGDITGYERPVKLSDIGIASPPQTFMYLTETVFDEIARRGRGGLSAKKKDRRILVLGCRPVEDMAFAKSVANVMRLDCYLLDDDVASSKCGVRTDNILSTQETVRDDSHESSSWFASGGVLCFRSLLDDEALFGWTLEKFASMLEKLEPSQIILLNPKANGDVPQSSLKSEEGLDSRRIRGVMALKCREIESIARRMRVRFTHVRV